MKRHRKEPAPTGAPAPLTHAPFASLGGGAAPASAGPAQPALQQPARAVVRLERKGRRGKEVTVVERLGLAVPQLDEWLRVLKSALGCGGAVVGANLIVQGDQRERVRAALEARGVKRVSVG